MKLQSKQAPADQAARDRFVTELDHNFSVLAPAGVGKTKSLVDRVVAIATSPQAAEWLPRLVVVTYTKKAADEMYQRARNAIIEQRVGLPILTQFNHAFFGTLHSFCVRLLRTHGHLCGLPSQFEPVEDDEELWREFVSQTDRLAPRLPPAQVAQILRLVEVDKLLALAHALPTDALRAEFPPLPPPPVPELKWVLGFTGKKSTPDTILRSQRAAREWQEAWTGGQDFAPLPDSQSSAKEFATCWENAFVPLRTWMGQATLRVATDLAVAYQAYRHQRGALTFDDQISLAWDLVRDPLAGRRLREEGFRIILDEAQDTDPAQFNILLELARPPSVRGLWMESDGAPPEPGRYCMVGDPQQSIYGDRADLAHYTAVREKLAGAGAADELVFTVTFRCDQAIIRAVNDLVQPMFTRTDGQVTYHPLTARPGAGPGQVLRWTPAKTPDGLKGVEPVTLHEARQLAAWLKELGPTGLGAGSWSEVAVLAPRTRWLQTLSHALQEAGLLPQVHSERSVQADDPAYAWATALLHVLAQPGDGFEVIGVLREIYGLSDEALAWYAQGDGAVWNLTSPPPPGGEVANVLRALGTLHAAVQNLPVREAARQAFAQTTLRARLAAVPGIGDDLELRLESLLVQASQAEADGLSLSEFAEQLRDGMETGVPARPVQHDAIQLLTCHKAKGLQWEVVVLPLMYRPISPLNKYPVLLRTRPGLEPQVAFSSRDVGDATDQVNLKSRQEMQRLLYVALTRAKRTLVLADDYALFKAKKANRSFADLLGMMDPEGKAVFHEAWNQLNETPAPLELPAPPTAKPTLTPWNPLTDTDLAAAQKQAQDVAHRVLPYQLGEAQARTERALAEPEGARSEGAEAARAYGIWWHETIENLDWRGGPAVWAGAWKTGLAGCPDAARGEREGHALFASDTAQRLAKPGLVLHREMPILWRRSAQECVEGIMDLAAWDPERKRWLIVDWKTNVIGPDGHEHLRAMYEPQLRAYAEALHEITGASVEAGVHSTVTGGWVPCMEIP
jgi:ATP-dependent helicase/nuclease subunit A